jgi:uncharacterized protein with PQ loop repeat
MTFGIPYDYRVTDHILSVQTCPAVMATWTDWDSFQLASHPVVSSHCNSSDFSISFLSTIYQNTKMTNLGVVALQLMGPVFVMCFQASSVKTAVDIMQARSVKQYSIVPFVSLFVNSVLWMYYGVLKSDNTVLVPNLCGVFAGGFCVVVYLMNTPLMQKIYIYGIIAMLALSTFLFVSGNASLLGLIGCGLAIMVMGSPLATVATVVRDKSTASMPFLTSLAGWLNALSWSAYGVIVANDIMVS